MLNKSDVTLVSGATSSTEEVTFDSPDEIKITDLNTTTLKCATNPITMTREDLGDDIAHYTFEVTMGSGDYDVVRLHHLIMEKCPYVPYKTNADIFMIHGAIQNFVDIFLKYGAECINEDTSAPYYLALNGVDV